MSKLKLDLIKNSTSYFREAIAYAQRDELDETRWKFAIINVVQAMELAFKEKLRRIHPVLIYSAVDDRRDTISLKTALKRLVDPGIGGLLVAEKDPRKIETTVKLRNELTHFECEHEHEYMEAKFADIFSFMIFFYREHLGLKTEEFIDYDDHQRIIGLVKTRTELRARARSYIKTEGFIDVWICPSCDESTFVAQNGECCFCHHKEAVLECASCGQETLESDMIDTSNFFDWDYDEGRMVLMEDFGMEMTACQGCIETFKSKVEDMRRAQYYEDMERDAMGYR
jgi:hypothetical protein